LAALAAGASEESCLALEREVIDKWQDHADNGGTRDAQPMVTVIAMK